MFSKHISGFTLIVDDHEDPIIKVEAKHAINAPDDVDSIRIVVGVPEEGSMVALILPKLAFCELMEKLNVEYVAAGWGDPVEPHNADN